MSEKILDLKKTETVDPLSSNIYSRLLFLKVGLMMIRKLLYRIIVFYADGFRSMKLGRTLWAIILIKLLIMFGVLKIFFFPDYLHENFSTDLERAEHVSINLTQIPTQK